MTALRIAELVLLVVVLPTATGAAGLFIGDWLNKLFRRKKPAPVLVETHSLIEAAAIEAIVSRAANSSRAAIKHYNALTEAHSH